MASGSFLCVEAWFGTLWYTALKWQPIADYMNMINYDAMAFGNHEFDDGLSGLEPFVRNLSVPLVNSNILDNGGTLKDLFQTHIVKVLNGQKIGIVGCTTVETSAVSNPGPSLKFSDEVLALRPVVQRLKADGINKIIVLSHAGITTDKEICSQVADVDIVVGGHSHTFLWSGEPPSTEFPEGPYPETIQNRRTNKTCLVVQSYAYGKYLGRIQALFDDDGHLKNWTGNPVLLDAQTFPEDPELQRLLNPYRSKLEHFQKTIVATTAVALDGQRKSCRLKECNLGNMLADAAVFFYTKRQMAAPENYTGWSTVAIGLWNGGGVRDFEAHARTNITLEDLYTIMPFQNTIDKIKMKGVHLKEAFEHAVADYSPADTNGKFLQVSGVHVVYDLSRPNGQRVRRLRLRCDICGVPKYFPVEYDRVYDVVTHTYLTGGGDGYTMLRDKRLESDSSNILDIDAVVDYVKTYRPLVNGEELRIEFLNCEGDTAPLPSANATECDL